MTPPHNVSPSVPWSVTRRRRAIRAWLAGTVTTRLATGPSAPRPARATQITRLSDEAATGLRGQSPAALRGGPAPGPYPVATPPDQAD